MDFLAGSQPMKSLSTFGNGNTVSFVPVSLPLEELDSCGLGLHLLMAWPRAGGPQGVLVCAVPLKQEGQSPRGDCGELPVWRPYCQGVCVSEEMSGNPLLRAYQVASFLVRVGLTILFVNGAAFMAAAVPEPPRVGGAGVDSVVPSTVSDDLTDDGAPFVECHCVPGTHEPSQSLLR